MLPWQLTLLGWVRVRDWVGVTEMTKFCVARTISVFRDIPEHETIALRLDGENRTTASLCWDSRKHPDHNKNVSKQCSSETRDWYTITFLFTPKKPSHIQNKKRELLTNLRGSKGLNRTYCNKLLKNLTAQHYFTKMITYNCSHKHENQNRTYLQARLAHIPIKKVKGRKKAEKFLKSA